MAYNPNEYKAGWHKKNDTIIKISLPKRLGEAFRVHCKTNKISMQSVVKGIMQRYVEKNS